MVAGVAPFVFLEPSFGILPFQDALEPFGLQLIPTVGGKETPRLLQAENDQGLMIGESSALVMAGQPISASLALSEREGVARHAGRKAQAEPVGARSR